MDIETQDSAFRSLPVARDLFYGGEWHAPINGRYVDTIDPSTSSVVATIAHADRTDTENAIQAAHSAWKEWRNTPIRSRQNMMRQAAERLRAHADELALIDAIDTGNPIAEMLGDAQFAANSLDYFAGLAPMLKGETFPIAGDSLHYSMREAIGVVARIVAYNHPLMFAAGKIAAPLAAGNTVIVKPPEQAPLSCLRLAELLKDVFPPGVLSVLPGGRECGETLSSHPLVKKVTLIGSVATGRAILRNASETLKPTLLELGGKNALIAFADADHDALVAGIVRGMNFTWAGQSCGSTSRVFLHESIHDKVLSAVADRTRQLHAPGNPTDRSTTMGPLISAQRRDEVLEFIKSAQTEGARLVTGGKAPDDAKFRNGFFIEPTIFSDVQPSMRIAKEEIFGPVMSVFRWRDEEELFDAVNGVEYGLTASIWTKDLVTAHRAAARVEAGYVWINQVSRHYLGVPFGGVKSSGIGREECIEELFDFTTTKSVNLQL
ncbi:aldehyde dehydrogenase family protein [Caballeronia sp. AZ10_KS36]|uniref:aldehyde dehydrogenase family protein n=1 Tax=Caballeronia sp. AZ10_KS36 TaxID=2921757 RepID=UPI002028425B|nr:aldehyde dehydrogenase family protein [Caballeronia sp. AZ10_KS36]